MEKITIPLFIINFNRLTLLKKQLDFFRTIKDVHLQIVIIDNCSSYPPLLEFYNNKFDMNNQLPIHNGFGNYYESDDNIILFKSNDNKVQCAPWTTGVVQSFIYDNWIDSYQRYFDRGAQCCNKGWCGIELLKETDDWHMKSFNKIHRCDVCTEAWKDMKIKHKYYIVTDSDLSFDNMPIDFISKYVTVLEEKSELSKVGPGFPTHDIPDWYPLKNQIKQHENTMYRESVSTSTGLKLHRSGIDTTFALYRSDNINTLHPNREPVVVTSNMTGVSIGCAARSLGKYVCKHMPWYLNPLEDDEENYYLRHCGGGWTASQLHNMKEYMNKVKEK